jgi:hypothetical protein
MNELMGQRSIVAMRARERFEERQVDEIAGRRIVGARLAMANNGAGRRDELVNGCVARVGIDDARSCIRVSDLGWQVVDLGDVKDGETF